MFDPNEIMRYLLVGSGVTLADTVIFLVLTGRRYGMAGVPANVISTTCGMALGFSLHLLLVFCPEESLIPVRFLKYLMIVAISVYGVQNLVIYTLEEVWRWPARLVRLAAGPLALAFPAVEAADRLFCKVAGVLLGVLWNFYAFKYFVYA